MQFINLPYEIKAYIFALSACIDPYSPPVTLSTLSRTCRHFHLILHGSPKCPRHDVAGYVFKDHFDIEAPMRRSLGPLTNEICSTELKRRRCALRRIITGNIYGEVVVRDLWVAYLMLLEDDGKNLVQLEHAHIEQWVKDIIRFRGREELDNNGWPVETELMQLAVAVLARVSNRNTVAQESEEECDELLSMIHPFFVAGHRYPAALLPTTQHAISRTRPLPAAHTHTFHTMASAPIYPAEELAFPYFGRRITLCRPPIALSCIAVWYLRGQKVPLGHLPNIPLDRAMAEARGYHHATVADYDEANLLQRLGYGIEVPRATVNNGGSYRWDQEWYRLALAHRVLEPDPSVDAQLRSCWYRTVYIPGMFTGNWVGRALVPAFRWYSRILQMHPAPLEVVAQSLEENDVVHAIMPMQLNIREHFTSVVGDSVGVGISPDGDNVQNAWFPDEVDFGRLRGVRLTSDALVIRDPNEPDTEHMMKSYKTWRPDVNFPDADPAPTFPLSSIDESSRSHFHPISPELESIFDDEFEVPNGYEEIMDVDDEIPRQVDVILSGETDYVHGEAWGHCKIYGRVRRNDGLFVLVRMPLSQNFGRWIFRGHTFGSHAILGRWRETGTSADVAGWEGTFLFARVPDSWPHISG